MKKNLFIISSPLQLVNIQELIVDKNLNQNTIIALYINDNQREHIKNTSFFLGIKNIKYFKRKRILAYLYMVFIGVKIWRVNYFVFGNLLDNHHLFLCSLVKKNKTILVDDGFLTIESFSRYKKLDYPSNITFFLKFPLNLHFFTSHDLIESKNIIKNEFKNLSKLSRFKKTSNIVYFIGARVYQRIGERNHIKIIKNLSDSNKKFIYFPHRRESLGFLKKLEDSGVIVSKENMAFELILIKSNIIPSKIIGFISSAYWNIVSLNKLSFNGKIKLYFVPLVYFKSDYENLIQLGIKKLDIKTVLEKFKDKECEYISVTNQIK
tara:strand:+ start:47 stop:1012 length:966 start_codon:yes stop_codon:yes gene_type:complete